MPPTRKEPSSLTVFKTNLHSLQAIFVKQEWTNRRRILEFLAENSQRIRRVLALFAEFWHSSFGVLFLSLPLHRISVVATSPHVKIQCIWNKTLCRYINHRGKHIFHAFIFYPKAANKCPSNQQAAKSSGQLVKRAISWARMALSRSLCLVLLCAKKAAKPTTAKEG